MFLSAWLIIETIQRIQSDPGCDVWLTTPLVSSYWVQASSAACNIQCLDQEYYITEAQG